RRQDRLHVLVIFDGDAGPPRHAEGGEPGGLQVEALGHLEELGVLRIGTGPPALDVVEAELVEALANLDLVLNGERNSLALGPVPQRRVVKLHISRRMPPRRQRFSPLDRVSIRRARLAHTDAARFSAPPSGSLALRS